MLSIWRESGRLIEIPQWESNYMKQIISGHPAQEQRVLLYRSRKRREFELQY